MSQMTIANEKKNYERYNDLKPVEFLEFFSRMAELRFPTDALPLANKLVLLMNIVFPQLLRKQPNMAGTSEE